MADVQAISSIGEAGNKEFLLRYLSSDYRWVVTYDGAIVADRRDNVGKGGICPDGNVQLDIRIRFGPYERVAPWLAKGTMEGTIGIIVLKGNPCKVQLPLWDPVDASGQTGSCLYIVAGNSMGLEIKEWSKSLDREYTRRALSYIVGELKRIVNLPRGEDNGEYWRRILPAGSLGVKQQMTVEEGLVEEGLSGEYILKGFVNMGVQGYVRVSVIDLATGSDVSPIPKDLTMEYVGWSKDKTVFFPFTFHVWKNEDVLQQRLRLEVRFSPSNTEELLMVKEVQSSSENN